MGQDGRHEMGRATRPSFRLQRDKWREPRTRTMKGPNTEKKAAIWPTSRVSGEQASSPAEGSARAQGHLCDCPRPSLGWVSRCPTATQHWAAGLGLTPLVLQRLRAVRQRSSGPQE